MNSYSQKALTHNSNSGAGQEITEGSAEATLRLIARLPVPKDLEDRVMAGLRAAPRRGRVLHWPSMLHSNSGWVRGAAAAAIVFVVAGGGWGIYTRVQPGQAAKVIVMPRAGAGGGFSSAGAMRLPQTVNGPVVAQSVAAQSGNAQAATTQPMVVKPLQKVPSKVVSAVVPATNGRSRVDVVNKKLTQPPVSAQQ